MSTSRRLGRREFLARSAGGLAAPYVLASGALSAPGQPGANDTIGVGVIGPGRRGRSFLRMPRGAQVVAIADVNRPRMDRVAGTRNWRKFPDYRQMLELREVDAVVVATPDHWHALNCIHAMQAGKDVYVEKPMTLTVREGRVMVAIARRHQRIVQVGSQQRSSNACRIGCELVRNGRIGRVTEVHGHNYPSPWEPNLPAQPVPEGLDWNFWLGRTPVHPYNIDIYTPRRNPGWISFRPWSGGEMTGWGSHGLDIIQWGLGTERTGPVELWPTGEGLRCPVHFRFANGVVVHLDQRGVRGGGIFHGTEGQMMVDRGRYRGTPEELSRQPLEDPQVRLYRSTNHVGNWLACMRSRQQPICDVEIGHRSTSLCHLGNIARWARRRLRWDPEREQFVGDDEANALLQRPLRAPWRLPEVS